MNINTETNVNVIKVCNGTETVVYTGLLSKYENGMFLTDVNMMYDNIFYEKIMIKDKRLNVPLKISNKSFEKKR